MKTVTYRYRPKRAFNEGGILKELEKFGQTFKNQLVSFVISAFSFAAALQWNDVISSLLKAYQNSVYNSFLAQNLWFLKLIGAATVSIVAIIAIYFLSKLKES